MDTKRPKGDSEDQAQLEIVETAFTASEKRAGHNVHGAAERGFVATDQ